MTVIVMVYTTYMGIGQNFEEEKITTVCLKSADNKKYEAVTHRDPSL